MYAVCGKHVHECVGEHTCVDLYGGQRWTQHFPPQRSACFLRQGFFQNLTLFWLEWLAVNPAVYLAVHPLCADGFQGQTSSPGFFVGAGNPKSGPRACVGSCLLPDHLTSSRQLQIFMESTIVFLIRICWDFFQVSLVSFFEYFHNSSLEVQ